MLYHNHWLKLLLLLLSNEISKLFSHRLSLGPNPPSYIYVAAYLDQRFSSGVILSLRGHLAKSENIFDRYYW